MRAEDPYQQIRTKAPAKQDEQWSGQVKQDDILSMPFTSKNAVFTTPFEVLEYKDIESEIKTSELAKDEIATCEKFDDVASFATAPSCPKCDSEMIQRVAKKGARQGQTFYGCSQFPKCRGVVNASV